MRSFIICFVQTCLSNIHGYLLFPRSQVQDAMRHLINISYIKAFLMRSIFSFLSPFYLSYISNIRSLCLLLHMTWNVPSRIIQVHKSAIHIRHRLKYILQTLPQIMTIPQRHTFIQHHINLHIQFIARVVRLQALYRLNCLREPHGEVKKDITVCSKRSGTSKLFDVRAGCSAPIKNHV